MTRFILFLTTMFLFSCKENIEQSYKDYQDFIKISDSNKSWFPDFISKDCYNIKEVHNIDNNNSFGTFNYRNGNKIDSLLFQKRTNKITIQEFFALTKKVKSPKQPAWFLNIKNAAGLEFFQLKNMCIAKDTITKKIYFMHASF